MLLRYLQPRAARPARAAVAVRRVAADAAAVLEAVGVAGPVAAEAVAVVVLEVAAGATDAAAAIAVDVAGLGRIAGKGASSWRT